MLKVTPLTEVPGSPARAGSTKTVAQLRVEGNLTRDGLAALHAAVAPHVRCREPLVLLLGDVRFADAPAIAALRKLEEAGAVLLGCSSFLQEMLAEAAAGAEATTEAALVAALRRGEPEAFETLVRKHGGRMLQVARRILAGGEDAQDVVQESFLAAFRAIGEFGGGARLSTWLHRITVNTALMRIRSRKRRPEEAIDDLLPRFDADGHRVDVGAAWDAPGEELLRRRETRLRVRQAIARLPESYRTVLMLRDIEDLDTEETAEALGISTNAVKIRLHRARQALRALLVDELRTDGEAARAVGE
jgi:RNA polymerase sigma-70 factor (ECF subfamily)